MSALRKAALCVSGVPALYMLSPGKSLTHCLRRAVHDGRRRSEKDT